MSTTTKAQPTSKAIITPQGDRAVRIERIFNAPRERVWKAMTDPDLVAQWWGRGNKLVVEKYEAARGGHWRFVEHAGGQTHGFEGRFAEIAPPEKIVQTFEWDGMPGHVALETMTLEDLGDGRTRLVTTSLFMTGEDRDGMLQSGMEAGANESWNNLAELLSQGQ